MRGFDAKLEHDRDTVGKARASLGCCMLWKYVEDDEQEKSFPVSHQLYKSVEKQ